MDGGRARPYAPRQDSKRRIRRTDFGPVSGYDIRRRSGGNPYRLEAEMKLTSFLGVAGAGALALAVTAASPAAAVEDIYKGRTVTVLVGYGPGGTYGQTSQLLAKYLDKKIPGNPTIIVQHMTGAGGLKMTNYAYNVAPKNGMFLMMPPEMTLVSQLLRPDGVKYVTDKFTWLGTVFGANQVMIIRRDVGIKSLDELKKRELVVASTGTGSPTFLIPKMMNGIVGTKFKIVTGYTASAKTTLAVEQGEAHGMSNSWVSWQANHARWFTGGDKSYAQVLAQIGFAKEKDLANVPLLTELAGDKEDKAAAAMLSTASIIGRGFALPPGAPNAVVEPLRAAFWATVNDPTFKADAHKRKLPVLPIRGAELQKMIGDTMKEMSPAAIVRAKKHIFGK